MARKLSPGLTQSRRTIPDARSGNMAKSAQTGKQNLPAYFYEQYSPKVLNQLASRMDPKVVAALKIATEVHKRLPESYRMNPVNMNRIKNTVDKILPAFQGRPISLPSGSSNDNSANSSYGLSKAPNPKPVSLNSGVAVNAYANDYMVPMTNSCSPLHISCATLQIPISASQTLSTYFKQTLAFDIQTRAQANVNFALDITGALSADALLTAMNDSIYALQIYFYYSSILAYESNPRNKNAGMIALRKGITPEILSDLTQLGRRLEDTPVPPRIVEWIRYMNMNFLSGNSQGAPIIKISPSVLALDTVISPTLPAVALSRINANTNTYTLLRRAIPQWRVGTLFDVPVLPVYDKDFVSIFANLPHQFYDGTQLTSGPNTAAVGTLFAFNSYNNKLDGVAYSMTSTFVAATGWFPGLVVPVATTTLASRRSYYINAGTPAWVNVIGNPFLVHSRQETYVYETPVSTPETPHLFGAEKVQGVSPLSLTQTAQNVLDFLFNIDSIPTKGKMASFNRTAMNKI